jgi:hypothetical protein
LAAERTVGIEVVKTIVDVLDYPIAEAALPAKRPSAAAPAKVGDRRSSWSVARMRWVKLLAVAPLALLSACNAARGPTSGLGFEPSPASYVRAPGRGVIAGQAFLHDGSGNSNVRYAAGETVRLIPATTYAQERIKKFYGSVKFLPAASVPDSEPDTQYASLTRTTTVDPDGRFTFENVAPGRYYLTTKLIWKPKNSTTPEGGAMYEEVTLTGQENGPVKVVLSGN